MRGMTHRWRWRVEPSGGDAASNAPSIPLLDRLLAARGIAADQAGAFLSPRLASLHSPSALAGVHEAASRILRALQAGEKIAIYGDYDVDGVAGAAILVRTILALAPSAAVETYIPHRLDEGYGLNADALRQLRARGIGLVVTVDCGISACEPARIAREIGLDLIITDHHNLPPNDNDLPCAVAIVHPRLQKNDQPYPCPDLCGASVAFKLAWRLATMFAGSERVGEELQKTLLSMLPLAALATIADVSPLTGENRTIASFGLRMIRQTSIVGLRALLEATGLDGENIDCEKVGFILGPHLNACGRMGHAAEAVRLLTTDDAAAARSIAQSLAVLNRDRQRTERAMFERAVAMAEVARMTDDDHRIIVLADPAWHPGVVGIACSRMVERFSRPAILLNAQKDRCKGSARSIEGYSIAAALVECNDLLESHGGHDMAAGLSLLAANLAPFAERITAHANQHIDAAALTPALTIDCSTTLEELAPPIVTQIGRCSPYGRGNPRPIVLIDEVRVQYPPRQIGGEGRHLSMQVQQIRNGANRALRCVWWKRGDLAGSFAPGTMLDLAVEPKINTWNGQSSVELDIRDVRLRMPTKK